MDANVTSTWCSGLDSRSNRGTNGREGRDEEKDGERGRHLFHADDTTGDRCGQSIVDTTGEAPQDHKGDHNTKAVGEWPDDKAEQTGERRGYAVRIETSDFVCDKAKHDTADCVKGAEDTEKVGGIGRGETNMGSVLFMCNNLGELKIFSYKIKVSLTGHKEKRRKVTRQCDDRTYQPNVEVDNLKRRQFDRRLELGLLTVTLGQALLEHSCTDRTHTDRHEADNAIGPG